MKIFNDLEPDDRFAHLCADTQRELRTEFDNLRRVAASWKFYLAIRLSDDPLFEEAEANYYSVPERRAA